MKRLRRLPRGLARTRASRRVFLRTAAAAGAALIPLPALVQPAAPQLIIIGGGFGGASCARALRRAHPMAQVTLIEATRTFTACPFSNGVIAGLRALEAQQFGYQGLVNDRI